MSRGITRERDVREFLQQRGYVVVRAAGSLGPVDLVALKAKKRPMFVEVKSTVGGAYNHFVPKDRQLMVTVAEQAGASAWLCWWPACKPGQRKADALRWIHSRDWPAVPPPPLSKAIMVCKRCGEHLREPKQHRTCGFCIRERRDAA